MAPPARRPRGRRTEHRDPRGRQPGWGADEAIAIIRTIEEAGIDVELVERWPVAGHDLAGLGQVTRAVDTPILADEAAFSVDDARRILDEGAAGLVNIKLMKSGGITGARRIAALADKAGVACMIGSMLETKLAVNAASHVAVACPSVTMVDWTDRCCAPAIR